jgi:hypothetical protein
MKAPRDSGSLRFAIEISFHILTGCCPKRFSKQNIAKIVKVQIRRICILCPANLAIGKINQTNPGAVRGRFRGCIESYLKAPNKCTFRQVILTASFKPTKNRLPDRGSIPGEGSHRYSRAYRFRANLCRTSTTCLSLSAITGSNVSIANGAPFRPIPSVTASVEPIFLLC